jgi:hypothetical protein
MISDTLARAIRDIEVYQASPTMIPDYTELAGVVDKVTDLMKGLRLALDLPPIGASQAKRQLLIDALAAIDTTQLREAIDS